MSLPAASSPSISSFPVHSTLDSTRIPSTPLSRFADRPSSARYMIGIMSGTSMDGVDAVVADFNTNEKNPNGSTRGQQLSHIFLPMPAELKEKLLLINSPVSDPSLGGELHLAAILSNSLAHLYADAIRTLLQHSGLSHDSILAVANHGQTVRHRPECGYTIQLSNNSLLAELIGIPVIGDFRSRDVAAGGTGAPLVPPFHEYWFNQGTLQSGMFILNLGGIANITHITPSTSGSNQSTVNGFDTGPANVLSDIWINEKRGLSYDHEGEWAKSGTVNDELLNLLLDEEYFRRSPPKSTGRDLFHRPWLETKLQHFHHLTHADIAATLIELTAVTVTDAIKATSIVSPSPSSSSSSSSYEPVFVCGGGARNCHLLTRLIHHLPHRRVESSLSHGLDVDTVESMAFAWFGWKFLNGETANRPKVTGAKGERILGTYFPA